MDRDSFLIWWLLGIPIVLAIVDRLMIGKSSSPNAGTADGYVARQGEGRPIPDIAGVSTATHPLRP